jgi:hypothetical protein
MGVRANGDAFSGLLRICSSVSKLDISLFGTTAGVGFWLR